MIVFITVLDGDDGLVAVLCRKTYVQERRALEEEFTAVLVLESASETCFMDASNSRLLGKKFGMGRSRNAKCELRPVDYKHGKQGIFYM
jgi:hypothetical protein